MKLSHHHPIRHRCGDGNPLRSETSHALATATVSANPVSLDHPAIHDLTVDGARIAFYCEDAQIGSVLPLLARLGVRNLTVNPPSLEEMFLQHYWDPTVER